MNRTQAEAIATAATRIRTDWHHPGTLAALHKAAHLGSPASVAAALFRLADDPEQRTPAMLHQPGPWWAATTIAGRRPPTMCGLHPAHKALGCPDCAGDLGDVDHAAHVARIRATLRAAKGNR